MTPRGCARRCREHHGFLRHHIRIRAVHPIFGFKVEVGHLDAILLRPIIYSKLQFCTHPLPLRLAMPFRQWLKDGDWKEPSPKLYIWTRRNIAH